MDQEAIIELLGDCLLPDGGIDLVARLEGLSTGQWNQLFQQAERHGLAPLLDHCLRLCSPGPVVPPDAAGKLKKAVHIGAGRNMRIFEQLSRMLAALGREKIPVVVLKGAHLASSVYECIEHRQMNDVDLLIPVPDLRRAADVFEGLGYEPVEEVRVEQARARSQHLPTFTRRGAAPVEVHWNLERPSSPFQVDLEGLWRRAIPERVAGEEALVLAPEDLLLHTCLHAGYHHRFVVPLKVFADVAWILRRHGARLDWELLAARVGRWGASRPVHLCLLLARELLGAAVPESSLCSLEPADFDPELTTAAREQVLVYSEDQQYVPWLSRKHARLWAREWSWGSPSFWFGRLFLPRRTLSRKYGAAPGSGRILLYYPVRARDILFKVGRGTGRLLRGRRRRQESARREFLLGEYLTRG